MLAIRDAYVPNFAPKRKAVCLRVHGSVGGKTSARARVGASRSDGDSILDSNGERWSVEGGTELPWGRVRARTDGYGGYTTNWYSRDFSGDSGLDGFISAYAMANAGASEAAKATLSKKSGGSGGGGGGGGGGYVAVKPAPKAGEVETYAAGDSSVWWAVAAGVVTFVGIVIWKTAA